MTASSPRPSFSVSHRVTRAVLVAAFVALLAVSLAPRAEAAETNPFVATFGSFSNARGVGADEAGNVYVIDNGSFPQSLSKFDSSGNPVDFSALGSNALTPPFGFSGDPQVAVDRSGGATAGDIYVASGGSVQVFDADGTSKGVIDQADGAGFSEACGVAVGPTGTLYVADFGGRINRYVPAASPATNDDYDAAITGLSSPCEIAVDSTGAVYVAGYPDGPLTKFTADQFGGVGTGAPIAASANAVAVDPTSDDVYVSRSSNDVAVYDSSGNLLREFGAGQVGTPPLGVAVAGTGHVFVANGSAGTVSIFGPSVVVPAVTLGAPTGVGSGSMTLHGTVNPNGVAVTDCYFEYGLTTAYGQTAPCAESVGSGTTDVPVSAALSGLDAGDYHFRLVAANANGTSRTGDQTVIVPSPPRITDQAATLVTATAATLRAKVNPASLAANYHFEYTDDADFQANGFANATHTPNASLNATLADVPVSQQIAGLTPSTTYHFRVVATNSIDTTEGPDTTFTTRPDTTAPDPCPNAQFRTGPSAALPDCRAYEQVSPTDKGLSDINIAGVVASSPDGSTASYSTFNPLPGSNTGPVLPGYASTRSSNGWEMFSVHPLSGTQTSPFLNQTFSYGGSDDLTQLMVYSPVALTPGAAEENGANLYAFDTDAGTYELVAAIESNPFAWLSIAYAGGASDGSSHVFSMIPALSSTPAPPPAAERSLYQWSHDDGLQLVGVLPDGTVNPNGSIAAGQVNANVAVGIHSVSDDGSRVFWTEPAFNVGDERPVYLRESGQTRAVSRDESDTVRPAVFRYATPDGAQGFLTSTSRLTADASPAGADLYRYDADSDQLTNLTPTTDPAGADVIGTFGASDDGNYVYFLANGALAPGASAGQPNIFVWHDGEIRFIGSLASQAAEIIGTNDPNIIAHFGTRWRVSADGRSFGFLFAGAISGPSPQAEPAFRQAYLYSYGDESLVCASCSDDPAIGPARFFDGGDNVDSSSSPTLGALTTERFAVTNGGRLFLTSPDALVAEDTNGQSGCPALGDPGLNIRKCQDVYEYVDGERRLISTGKSGTAAAFGGATKDGASAFLLTYERLVGQDQDNNADLYVARVGGGLASQHPPPADPPCQGDGCQGSPSSAPGAPGAGSNSFRGAGNVKKAPRAAIGSIRRLSASARAALAKGGKARLRLKVNGAGTVTLAGTARISKRNRRVVSSSAKAKRAGSVSVPFALSKSARVELRSKRRLTVRLAVRFKNARPKVVSVTLKAPTSKKGGRS